MTKLSKNIGFGVSEKDKNALKEKSEELGLSMSAMIRNIILEKYKFLQVGYMQPMEHDIDIKGLKRPATSSKRPPSRSDAYIADLKTVFAKGINILDNMENAGLKTKAMFKMKTDKELKQVLRDKNIRVFLKKLSYAYKIPLSKH